MDEGYIHRDATSSRRSCDATHRDDVLTPGDELFGDGMNVKSPMLAI